MISKIRKILLDRFGKITARINERRAMDLLFFGAFLVLALLLRYALLKFQSNDYHCCLDPWYTFILNNGRFAAFKYGFADYNPPYLYLLSLSTLLPFAKIYSIKLISIIFDFILAVSVYKIIKEKYNRNPIAWVAFFAILFAPTVFLNSSFWGQCDAIFTSFIILSLYFLIKQKNDFAAIAFGVAVSFKLQAAFFLPVLFILFLKKKISFKSLLYVPAVFLLSLVPALIAGRPFAELLKVYVAQANSQRKLTMNAPNLYQWISNSNFKYFNPAGSVFAVFALLALSYFVYKSRKEITREILIKLSLLSVLMVPYFLPKMHERYFFPADIISIIYAFYNPKKFYLPIVINLVSFFSYTPFLFGKTIVPLPYVAIALSVVILIVLVDLLKDLYPSEEKRRQIDQLS